MLVWTRKQCFVFKSAWGLFIIDLFLKIETKVIDLLTGWQLRDQLSGSAYSTKFTLFRLKQVHYDVASRDACAEPFHPSFWAVVKEDSLEDWLTVIICVIYRFKWISKYVFWWEDRKTEGFCDEPWQVTMSYFLTSPRPALVHHKHTLGNSKPHNASVKATILHASIWFQLRRKEPTEDLTSVSVKKPIGPFGPRLFRTQCSEHVNFLSWIRFFTLSKHFHIFPNKADSQTGKSLQTVSLKQHHSCEQTGQRTLKSGPSTTNTAVNWD